MQNIQVNSMKKLMMRMKVQNSLIRQCMGEIIGTFVLLLFGCSAAAQVKTSNQMKGQYLSANLSFSIGVMSAMYLSMGVSDAIMQFSGGVLTAYGPNETASIFGTYPTPGTSLQTNIFDQVSANG
ncbi:Aquaporin-10 [Bagarius yarrelli]|uniref:Aquaporin-10 n=1 Tax=Bagarius yarrelli TaxID=175774 RepID=A0A556V9X8_BAGYA|nr:Aquaporin-10 [Bagarius yarrelli]